MAATILLAVTTGRKGGKVLQTVIDIVTDMSKSLKKINNQSDGKPYKKENTLPLKREKSSKAVNDGKIVTDLNKKVKTSDFTRKYKGKSVILTNIEIRKISYTRRSRASLDELRKKFDSSVRKNYLKSLGRDKQKVTVMKDAGLSDIQIVKIANGNVPKGYNVHHKIPIDDGGTNDFDNLVLIRNNSEHYTITNAQRDLTSHIPYGDTVDVEFPVPTSFIYPSSGLS